ncbi:hypothetical protein BHE90_007130 [Fusarium euwallaceae]|uniref:Uncharacterized protein n=2 Tax=Fusarium solani species complex TaxID=232080 RepID=A0A428UCJ2_9HYPO|nr:hypothetical protein CEP52_002819 [Fusarium oligoseptatum]RTE78363.1 hypothetical protein BHE90_007130 [Fusarium euwallaceae]
MDLVGSRFEPPSNSLSPSWILRRLWMGLAGAVVPPTQPSTPSLLPPPAVGTAIRGHKVDNVFNSTASLTGEADPAAKGLVVCQGLLAGVTLRRVELAHGEKF